MYNTATRADISNGAWQKPPSCLIIRVTLQQIQAQGSGHHATITGTVCNLRNSDRLTDPGFKGVYWPVQQSERSSLSSSTGSYTRPKENAYLGLISSPRAGNFDSNRSIWTVRTLMIFYLWTLMKTKPLDGYASGRAQG